MAFRPSACLKWLCSRFALPTKYLVAASNSWNACMLWHGRKHENNTKAQSKRGQAVLLRHHTKHAKVRKTNNNNSSNGDDDVAPKKEETVLFDPLLKYHLTFVGITNLCIYTIYFSRRSTRASRTSHSALVAVLVSPCFVWTVEVCVCAWVLVACNGKCFYTKMYIYIVCRVFSYAFIFGSCFAPIPSPLSPNAWIDGVWQWSDCWVGLWLAVLLCLLPVVVIVVCRLLSKT